MAQETAKKFMDQLAGDKALQEKLAAALNAFAGNKSDEKAVFETVLAPIAKEAGFDFSYEDMLAASNASGELSDDELDQVAGGAHCFGLGFGKSDDATCCNVIGAGVPHSTPRRVYDAIGKVKDVVEDIAYTH